MFGKVQCSMCHELINYSIKQSTPKKSLLNHYKNNCRPRIFIDNSVKAIQANEFVELLESENKCDDNEGAVSYDDPGIIHALAYNDDNIIYDFDDNEMLRIAKAVENDMDPEPIFTDELYYSDEYLNFQVQILEIIKPSIKPPWKVGWIRSQQVDKTTHYNWRDSVQYKTFNQSSELECGP